MKKLFQFLVSMSLVFTLSACNQTSHDDKPITQAQLTSILHTKSTTDPASVVKLDQVLDQLFEYTEIPSSIIGESDNAVESYAKSLGLIPETGYDLNATVSNQELQKMLGVINQLKDAYFAKVKQPFFANGMAQPIFPYSTGKKMENYSNQESDIVRYCVYVETNYDTDGDGKLDLVKAVVQLPKACASGDYKAATIYEARPYISGCSPYFGDNSDLPGKDTDFNMKKLYAKPKPRVSQGSISTMDHALKADSNDWYYFSPYENIYDYEDLDWYDYFLVRGYAVVESAGIGTRGSEGFETCGSDVEIDAFKCIIEWLHGDRVAFSDKEHNIEIKADWSNGNVGMTGRSYSGTTQFGLATTGVEGLKTIVPVAGIASWYDYMNCQGTRIYPYPYDQLTALAMYCTGRYLDPEDWKTIENSYGSYLHSLEKETLKHGSNYFEEWENRDYTLKANNIKAPALIVHGLNDFNVRSKHYEMMLNAYQQAQVPAKLLLHQGAHITPSYVAGGYSIPIGNEQSFYEDLLNRWFTHYLYGLDNGVENIPNVLVQSNDDPLVWNQYDSYKTPNQLTLTCSSKDDRVEISSDYHAVNLEKSKKDEFMCKQSSYVNATYQAEVPEDTTIMGSVEVELTASMLDGIKDDNLVLSAMLVDVNDEPFPSFQLDDSNRHVLKDTIKEDGQWIGGGVDPLDIKQFKTSDSTYKVIESGWMDLCNPESGFDSKSSTNSTKLKLNEPHTYHLYLQPNVYRIKKGHRLALVIASYDPSVVDYPDDQYIFSVDTNSIKVSIPTVEKSSELIATYKQ